MPPDIVDLNDYQVDEWPSTEEGEIRQAKEVEHMYRILFENSNVEAITSWDYMDGLWLNAPAGFLRTDDTIKPSYEALDKLINKEWKTNLELTTDEEGYVEFEGFKGNYEITLKGNNVTLELNEDTKKKINI